MPAVSSGKVLVTGVNGYIGAWVVRYLLDAGFSVRATVRSADKADALRPLFSVTDDQLEFHTVPDMTTAGAFDDAVRGVHAVVHVASPTHYDADDPDEVINPALYGTTRVLESALAHGTAIQRIVITSSIGSIIDNGTPPRQFSELDWNQFAVDQVSEKGRAAGQQDKYCASKVLAERAAWQCVRKYKHEIAWDLVVLHPSYVFGPVAHAVATLEDLSGSMRIWYEGVFKTILPSIIVQWVDVRDTAQAHLLALQVAEAGGERIIISRGSFKWKDWTDAARAYGANVVEGHSPTVMRTVAMDNTKSQRLLGIRYRTLEETARDVISQFKEKGWISVTQV